MLTELKVQKYKSSERIYFEKLVADAPYNLEFKRLYIVLWHYHNKIVETMQSSAWAQQIYH